MLAAVLVMVGVSVLFTVSVLAAHSVEHDDTDSGDPWENAPVICPGCYSVGEEKCADWCPDDAIARRDEDDWMYEPNEESEGDDD